MGHSLSRRTLPLGDVLDSGTRNGIYKSKGFHGRGTKIINMGELFAFSRMHAVPMKRIDLTDDERRRFEVLPGDLLFARRSLVADGAGKCSIVLAVDECTVFESSIIRARPAPSKADSLYLYYLFSSPHGAHLLDTIRRDAVVAGITGTDLVRLPVELPGLREQRAIAHILGTLDDKIELNRKMNRTLEDMAQAIFQSWFIDFDEHTDLVESELGPVPKGWRTGTLEELTDAGRRAITSGPFGSKLTRSHYVPSGVPVIRGVNLGNGDSWFHDEDYVYIPEDYAASMEGCQAFPGDVLFTQRGTLGQVGLIPKASKAPYYILSQSQMKMTCASWVSPSYVFLYFRRKETIDYIQANATAAGVPHINLSFLRRFPILIPERDILDRFRNVMTPIEERIVANVEASRTLAALRDALLPRLLSGELSVSQAEYAAEPT